MLPWATWVLLGDYRETSWAQLGRYKDTSWGLLGYYFGTCWSLWFSLVTTWGLLLTNWRSIPLPGGQHWAVFCNLEPSRDIIDIIIFTKQAILKTYFVTLISISNYFLGQSDIWPTRWWCQHQRLEVFEVDPLLQCTGEEVRVWVVFLSQCVWAVYVSFCVCVYVCAFVCWCFFVTNIVCTW